MQCQSLPNEPSNVLIEPELALDIQDPQFLDIVQRQQIDVVDSLPFLELPNQFPQRTQLLLLLHQLLQNLFAVSSPQLGLVFGVLEVDVLLVASVDEDGYCCLGQETASHLDYLPAL